MLTSAHAAPGSFLSMGVVMSATAALDWLGRLTGQPPAELAAGAAALWASGGAGQAPVFLPALNGIRTPQGRPDATGRFDGVRPGSGRDAFAWAVLEGVAFQIAASVSAQRAAGVPFERLAVVGGGARSTLWVTMVASLLDRPAFVPRNAANAAAVGAVRLARVAAGLSAPETLSRRMEMSDGAVIAPDPDLSAMLRARRPAFDALLPTA